MILRYRWDAGEIEIFSKHLHSVFFRKEDTKPILDPPL